VPVQERRIFNEFISSKGLKKTVQRSLVLETFLSINKHVSVEDVYRIVNKKAHRVGLVTIYRTMKLIAGSGLAREVMFDDGMIKFEHAYGRQHHHHMVCTNCKQVIEFSSLQMDKAEEAVLETHDFEVSYHRYEIFGLCRECRNVGAKKKTGRVRLRTGNENIINQR